MNADTEFLLNQTETHQANKFNNEIHMVNGMPVQTGRGGGKSECVTKMFHMKANFFYFS